jgi:hypothetical protein
MTTLLKSQDAGSLYNCINGERQYARVDGDRVISIGGFSVDPPEVGWLPVEYLDSQPFDAGQHYRDPPTNQVIRARVVRTFQVRAKRPDEIKWEQQ